jgi:Dolichyl-phosphate-mannose-protein mannosyltransferase
VPEPVSDTPASERGPRGALLDGADVVAILALVAVGTGVRLRFASGWGLGDDVLFRHFINQILSQGIIPPDNSAYRFTWWFPTALACRILGLGERGMILPITIADALGIGVVYALGKALYGRAGALIAALLLLVHPLDFAWSTMMASDIFLSLTAALTVLCVLRALAADDPRRKARLWAAAGVTLWLAYHAKVSAVLLVPALAVILWRHRDRLDARVGWFAASAGLFLGASALVAYVLAGDPLAPYHSELSFQGLNRPDAITFHRLTAPVFWTWRDVLFFPDALGDLLFSYYPHVLVALAVLGVLFRIGPQVDVLVWLVFVFLGMQFNIQRVEGVWVAGFRNVRHAHVFVYPMVLLLAGYLVAFRARVPRLVYGGLVVLLAVSAWQAVSVASKTRAAFADRRAACAFLATLPPKPVYSDFQMATWASITTLPHPWKTLAGGPAERRRDIAGISDGYLVTGGGREPIYGCVDCIPRADEVDPQRWRLLLELPGPATPTPWRPEPLRVWEVTR